MVSYSKFPSYQKEFTYSNLKCSLRSICKIIINYFRVDYCFVRYNETRHLLAGRQFDGWDIDRVGVYVREKDGGKYGKESKGKGEEITKAVRQNCVSDMFGRSSRWWQITHQHWRAISTTNSWVLQSTWMAV